MPTPSPPKKEGELLKYKNLLSGWAKRYFRLERVYLHYYDSKYSHSPLATVTRGEIIQVKPSNQFPGREHVFEIYQKSGMVWYCQAKTSAEMVEWMRVLSPVPIMIDTMPLMPTMPSEGAAVPPPMNPQHPQTSQETTVYQGPFSPYQGLMNEAQTAVSASSRDDGVPKNWSPPPAYSPYGPYS